jgi:hypothetical protein
MAIAFEGQTYRVIAAEYHPGQGKMGGAAHAHLQNLETGTLRDYSFRSDLKLQDVPLDKQSLKFLYRDGGQCCVMNPLIARSIQNAVLDREFSPRPSPPYKIPTNRQIEPPHQVRCDTSRAIVRFLGQDLRNSQPQPLLRPERREVIEIGGAFEQLRRNGAVDDDPIASDIAQDAVVRGAGLRRISWCSGRPSIDTTRCRHPSAAQCAGMGRTALVTS